MRRARYLYLHGEWEKNPTFCQKIFFDDTWRPNTEIQDRINLLCGLRRTKQPRRQVRRPHGFCKAMAAYVLEEITGLPELVNLPLSPGKLSPNHEWLLDIIFRLQEHFPSSYAKRDFLTAIAKDAGVWPPPKWWIVTRRLQDSTRITIQK